MTRKQSPADRAERLNKGCCPIHGLFMPQVDSWHEETRGALDGAQYTIVGCPRRDCNIRAKTYDFKGPGELLPEFAYLLRSEDEN